MIASGATITPPLGLRMSWRSATASSPTLFIEENCRPMYR
jgi:hypothetical protein